MIYEGAISIRTIEEFVQSEKGVNLNGDIIGFKKPIFLFAQKYLVNKSYKDFLKFRKQEIVNNITNNNNKIMAFFKTKFIFFYSLKFDKNSYQYNAIKHYFSFLDPIIRNQVKIFNYSPLSTLKSKESEFNDNQVLDEFTFEVIKNYAKAYIDWVEFETKNNPKLNIQNKINKF